MGWLSNLVSFLSGKNGRKKKGTELGSSDGSDFGSLSSLFSNLSDAQLRQRNAQYCACADCLADAFSTVEFRYEIGDRKVEEGDLRFRELLTLSPNPVQTSSQFQKTVASAFFREQLAVVWIQRERGEPVALWPMDTQTIKVSYADTGDIFLTFPNQSYLAPDRGAEITVPLDDCIVLTRKPNADNPFETLDPSVSRILRVIETNYDGFEAAVKQSHLIRYILTKPSVDNKDEERRAAFRKQLENDQEGLIILNHAESLQPINSNATYAKQPEMSDFEEAVYSYFHVTKAMVQSNMTDIQNHYFMQRAVAPLTVQYEQQCNRKLFTYRERSYRNRITAIMDPIDHASLDTKKSIANVLISSGVYRPNDIRRILSLDLLPPEEGETIVHSLNFSGDSMQSKNISNDNSSEEGQKTQEENKAAGSQGQEGTQNE